MSTTAARTFIGFLGVVLTSLAMAQTTLPVGRAPAALELGHFPDRLHAFVWRNWNLVATERMAAVLETSPQEVRQIAASMGLPLETPVPPEYASRLYLTVIRRNWHLLPYEQLLALLGWTPQRLAETLREDDFFWHKLGNLKPKCDRLTYAPPTESAKRRAAEIRQIVEDEFGPMMRQPGEARLAFLKELCGEVAQPRPVAPGGGVRFIYSYFAVFGDPLLDPSLDPYPDALLQRYADLGVNGVWLHVVLRQLAPPSKDFPEFGEGSAQRLANLAKLVARARRFGIGVYLYMNEPRAMPPEFFKDRPDMAGVREAGFTAMCTSHPRVRQWVSDSLEHVFRTVPDLGGVFTITASENLTSCASHFRQKDCAHCKDRPPAEVIAEVNAAIEAGVHRGSPAARVINWDWGWSDEWAADVIPLLPKRVELQSVSEWSLPITRGGVETKVGEYSLSAVGPGPRATKHWAIARQAGLRCNAKVQLNNTWECSAVPYLPVMDLVAEHCANLAAAGVDGMQLSWSLGGYPSPNLAIAQRFQERPAPTKEQVLDDLARERYGDLGAPYARRAWSTMSGAFREYPYNSTLIYLAPVQMGPANLLWERATGYNATMVGLPYDDLKHWCGPYPPAVFVGQFEKVANGWNGAIAELATAAAKAPPQQAAAAAAEVRFARAAYLHFRSTANQARFILARDAADKPAMRAALADEAAAAEELFALSHADARIGFEASNHYYYVPNDLIE